MAKLNFQQPLLQSLCHMVLKKNIYAAQYFVENVIYFSGFFEEYKVHQHLFKMEIFCNIINVFTVNFDQLNVFFLNKSTLLK